jgi:NRPS condensation-like uncharacterized protein
MFNKNVDYDPFAGGELSRVVPSTEAQKEIWASVLMGDDANRSFNESVTLTLKGELDVAAVRNALQYTVDRHEALRSTFGPDGETICISKASEVQFELVDLSHLSAQAMEQEFVRYTDRSVDTPYDLVNGPLFGACLCKFSDRESRLIIFGHHIVCDGWSMSVITTELGSIYSAYASGLEPQLDEPGQFGDFALSEWNQVR